MKKTIAIALIVTSIFLSIFLVLFAVMYGRFIYMDLLPNVPDDNYITEWVSEDEKIELTINYKKEILAYAIFEGKYKYNNSVMDLEVESDTKYCSGKIEKNNSEKKEMVTVFSGYESYNPFNNRLTIVIDEDSYEFSDYKKGDQIVLHKK